MLKRCWILLFALHFETLNAETLFYHVNDASQPLQIGNHENPMQGGIVTDIINHLILDTHIDLKAFYGPVKRLSVSWHKNKRFNNIGYGSPSWTKLKAGEGWYSNSPIMEWKQVLVTPKSSEFVYTKVTDLFNKSIILIHGYDYPGLDQFLKSNNPKGQIYDYRPKTNESAIGMLNLGRGIGFVDAKIRAQFNISSLGFKHSNYRYHDLSMTIPSYSIYLYFGPNVTEKNRDLINNKLDSIIESGYINTIIEKYR